MLLPMARDLGRYGIRCAAIAPGAVVTTLFDFATDKDKERINGDTPLGRPGTTDEIAHFV